MNLTNFKFSSDRIGIEAAGIYIDLHNNYELASYRRIDPHVQMLWMRLDEPWVNHDQPKQVTLKFLDVEYLDVRGEPSTDLDEIGFFDRASLGRVEYNGLSAPTPTDDILVLRFAGGGEIAIRSASTTATLSDQ